jgi:hypothetical protein
MGTLLTVAAAALSVGCTDYVTEGIAPAAPTNLSYQLEPSGDPLRPSGLLLKWDADQSGLVAVYHVYSRATSSEPFGLRGTTTSASFHDAGQPHLEYYVTAEGQGGLESEASTSIMVDERLRLPASLSLTSTSLNQAIHLRWNDNPYLSDPAGFWHYRVYSTSYDLDHNLCGTSWSLEGTTIAPAFLVGALSNGNPRCFAISAVTIEGFESLWSPLRYDTPRPDARAQVVFTPTGDPLKSGFRFFLDANNDGQVGPLELGLIGSGSSPSMDFTLAAGTGGALLLTPVRANTDLRLWATGTITDLTDMDIAPVGGYARTALAAQPGRGYVFRMNENDGFFRYGALRIVATGPDYIIFDWSYQTDPGNPELLRVGR